MFRFEYYDDSKETEWDNFVNERSINGTFMHTRRFLNYHEAGKFQDVSLMIYNMKNNLAAVIPACQVHENGRKTFFSHQGATFGGTVVDEKHYNAKCMMAMIKELQIFLKEEGYYEVYLRQTSDLFSIRESALFQYVYTYHGFREYKDLSTYIDYESYKENILSNFSQGKRTNVHNCIKEGLYLKQLDTEKEISEFYDILRQNLKKYDAEPVHSMKELMDFKEERLKNECDFFGIYKGDEMLAGSMMFYYHRTSCAHTQYLAANFAYNKLSPMTYTYYSMIEEMKKRGYAKVSWGIATVELGTILNEGLINSKEDFGSLYCNNYTYYYCFG